MPFFFSIFGVSPGLGISGVGGPLFIFFVLCIVSLCIYEIGLELMPSFSLLTWAELLKSSIPSYGPGDFPYLFCGNSDSCS